MSTDDLYFEIIDQMAEFFDASAERIKDEWTDPLKQNFRPEHLPWEWWSEQVTHLTKATDETKREIEVKIKKLNPKAFFSLDQ